MGDETAVEMFVGGLVLDPNTQSPVVILKDESGEVCLPIWIGIAEATSIASAIKQINMQRPLTHDLMYDIFGELGVRVERVLITELRESTYFAELVLAHGDKVMVVDSRPSDAIAIALRASAPILVAQQVLDQAKVKVNVGPPPAQGEEDQPQGEQGEGQAADAIPQQGGQDFTQVDREKWNDLLESLDPDDFKYKV
ncbi:MAG: bifunctional nuclease family protein [Bdellovibrionota bacterium]|nr:MAG: bifunctional nuclease family protein [Bdellovibrionota bacterium]